jgi:hypothetical protein
VEVLEEVAVLRGSGGKRKEGEGERAWRRVDSVLVSFLNEWNDLLYAFLGVGFCCCWNW